MTVVEVVDAQVHVWAPNRPDHPWRGPGHGQDEVTGEETVALMDRAGVAGAIMVSPWSIYRFDAGHTLAVAATHPERFRVVAPVDPDSPHGLDVIEDLRSNPLVVGLRLMVMNERHERQAREGRADQLLDAAQAAGDPVCVPCPGRIAVVDEIARRFPELRIVVDHLGIDQPRVRPAAAEPFRDLDELLALARHPNVFVKVTGLPTLSHRPFPFADLWPSLHRLFEAFGLERCMWGTDWTRTTAFASYEESLRCFTEADELSALETGQLVSGTARAVFGWTVPRQSPTEAERTDETG